MTPASSLIELTAVSCAGVIDTLSCLLRFVISSIAMIESMPNESKSASTSSRSTGIFRVDATVLAIVSNNVGSATALISNSLILLPT